MSIGNIKKGSQAQLLGAGGIQQQANTYILMTGIPEMASYREEEEEDINSTNRLTKVYKVSDISASNTN
jgi:hypothetical protein